MTTDDNSRIISSEHTLDDQKEKSLRPRLLDEFIGQEKIKRNLNIYIEAAKLRKAIRSLLDWGIRRPQIGLPSLLTSLEADLFVL